MTSYEKELLALTVEASGDYGLDVAPTPSGWRVCMWEDYGVKYREYRHGATLAEALTALLRDRGVEVPERPSAERVEYLHGALGAGSVHRWRGRFDREPLTVIALLEGGEA